MIINHRYQFVYVAAPRTASTSTRAWLSQLERSVVVPNQHQTDVPAECRGYFVFGTFRDPAERLLSLWRYHWRNDPDRRPLDRYLADLPTMHAFHSRSQMSYYHAVDAIVPVGPELERALIDRVFTARGFCPTFSERLPRLNSTLADPPAAATAVADRARQVWPDDWAEWTGRSSAAPSANAASPTRSSPT